MKNIVVLLVAILVNSINVFADSSSYDVDGILYKIIPEEDCAVEIIRANSIENIVIPEVVNIENIEYKVKRIHQAAFYENKMKTIVLPESIDSIEGYVFQYCKNLERITIPSNVKVLSDGLFSYCDLLMEINLPVGLTYIKTSFVDCPSLRKLKIPQNVTIIGASAFTKSPIEELVIDENNNHYAFIDGVLYNKDQSLLHTYFDSANKDFVVPETVKTIEKRAFSVRGLKTIIVNDNVEEIKEAAFAHCYDLESIKLSDTIKRLENGLLTYTGIKTIEIPEGVTSIANFVCSNCEQLEKVSMPSTLEEIGGYSFRGCTALKEINLYSVTPPNAISEMHFSDVTYELATLNVPIGSLELYKGHSVWGKFVNINEIDYSGIDTIKHKEISVKLIGNTIIVSGNENIEIYDISGNVIYRGENTHVEVSIPGVYIVRVGDIIKKVVL